MATRPRYIAVYSAGANFVPKRSDFAQIRQSVETIVATTGISKLISSLIYIYTSTRFVEYLICTVLDLELASHSNENIK